MKPPSTHSEATRYRLGTVDASECPGLLALIGPGDEELPYCLYRCSECGQVLRLRHDTRLEEAILPAEAPDIPPRVRDLVKDLVGRRKYLAAVKSNLHRIDRLHSEAVGAERAANRELYQALPEGQPLRLGGIDVVRDSLRRRVLLIHHEDEPRLEEPDDAP